MRSRNTRRANVYRSASGDGCRLFANIAQREMVDPIAWPMSPCLRGSGRHGSHWLNIRPMHGIMCALFDPLLKCGDFLRRQRFARVGGGHSLVGIGVRYPAYQFTGVGFAGHDRNGPRFQCGGSKLCVIQPQTSLTFPVVGTMAGKAFVRQNRSNITIEINRPICPGRTRKREPYQNGNSKQELCLLDRGHSTLESAARTQTISSNSFSAESSHLST